MSRSSAAGTTPALARSRSGGTAPSYRRYSPPAPVIVEAPRSPILDVVTSVELISHLDPGYASRNTHFAWEDQSDYSNHFTASGDERPTILPNWLDGNAGVSFDGVSQKLRRAVFRGIGIGSKPCAIVVCDVDAVQPEPAPTLLFFRSWVAATASASPFESPFNIEHTATTAKVYSYLGPSATDTRATGLAGTTSPRWLLAKSSNAANKPEVWVNGALKGIAGSGTAGGVYRTAIEATIGGGMVGSDPTNRWLAGVIGEIIIFDNEPTPGEFTDLFSAILAPRWPSLSWSFV